MRRINNRARNKSCRDHHRCRPSSRSLNSLTKPSSLNRDQSLLLVLDRRYNSNHRCYLNHRCNPSPQFILYLRRRRNRRLNLNRRCNHNRHCNSRNQSLHVNRSHHHRPHKSKFDLDMNFELERRGQSQSSHRNWIHSLECNRSKSCNIILSDCINHTICN